MFTRAVAIEIARSAIAACAPARRVGEALAAPELARRLAGRRRRLGVAIGKAAADMARGAGPVDDGVVVVPDGGAAVALGRGWRVFAASHPEPDVRSVAAGAEVAALVRSAGEGDIVLALLSGGASSLVEQPRLPLAELSAAIRAVMQAGAVIDEINAVRGALSELKGGQLALASAAPIATLAVSDVIGDPLAVIGSGPTVGAWLAHPGAAVDDGAAARNAAARAVLARYRVTVSPGVTRLLAGDLPARTVIRDDYARVIAPMVSCAHAACTQLAERGFAARLVEAPIAGEVDAVAGQLAAHRASGEICVAWGEPTLRVPQLHGEGGRAQQLALALARALRGGSRAALVIGTDGIDGPPPRERPSPAGAWVDGATWDAIAAAGRDPAESLAACDAGGALAAVGALVVTGPTGCNHADLVLIS